MITTYNKLHRAASETDYESWGESDVAPTQNVFDVGDVRATTIIVEEQPPIAFNWQNGGGYGVANDGLGITEDGVGPLTTSQTPAVAYGQGIREDGQAHTLTGEGSDASEDGTGRGTPVVTDARYTVRRLTPTECERLQGFPDGWTAFGIDGKPQSDTQRYKQLGNAVTVNVAEYIAALIQHAEDHYLPPRTGGDDDLEAQTEAAESLLADWVAEDEAAEMRRYGMVNVNDLDPGSFTVHGELVADGDEGVLAEIPDDFVDALNDGVPFEHVGVAGQVRVVDHDAPDGWRFDWPVDHVAVLLADAAADPRFAPHQMTLDEYAELGLIPLAPEGDWES